MKIFKKFVALSLCFIFIFSSFPVYAENGKFVKFTIENMDKDCKWSKDFAVCYVEKDKIYVPVSFLTEYTMYTFDYEKNIFTRTGQEPGSYFGRVEINVKKRTATVYQNRFSCKSYDLTDIYNFAEELYLPLDQLTAFLKSYITISKETIRIVTSGYSLVDAEYALSKLWSERKLLGYNLSNIVDDLYAGNWKAFYTLTTLKYFSTTIFEFKISNLDVFFNSGNVEKYEKFLESCITNNDCYVANFTTDDDLINRMNTVLELSKTVSKSSKTFEEATTIIEDLAKPLKDSDLGHSLLYSDFADLNAFFKAFNKVASIMDYYLKLGSMCEDNRKILINYDLLSNPKEREWTFNKAIADLARKYNPSTVSSIYGELSELFVRSFQDEISKAGNEAFEAVTQKIIGEKLPIKDAVKTVALVFKLCGIDLTDNSEYCATVGYVAKNYFASTFSGMEDNHFQNPKKTEQYRLMAIMYLLASIQCFENGNGLAKGLDLSDNFYDDKINKLSCVLVLFYAAVQSKEFDSFESIENIIKNNKKMISKSDILTSSNIVSLGDLKHLEPTDEEWGDLVNQINYYESILCTDSGSDFISMNLLKANQNVYNLIAGLNLYFRYFDDMNYGSITNTADKKDPLDKIHTEDNDYYEFDANKIDWIVTNVFNLTPDRNISNINSFGILYYHYNDSFYVACYPGDPSRLSWSIFKKEKIYWGMYDVTIRTTDELYPNDYYEINAKVKLKETDGKRYWSFIKIKKFA